MVNTIEKLEKERFNCLGIQPFFARIVEQLLQILIKELENQRELLVCVDHIMQLYNVLMLKLLQQRDFPNSCGGNTFVFGFKSDLLQSDYVSICLV